MKYLINRKTKEHKVLHRHTEYATCDWSIVEADPEGWIKHEGNECPLPDDAMCDTKWDDGIGAPTRAAGDWKWIDPAITHYRPILAEKAQEPEPIPATQYDPRSVSFNLLDRLKSAHDQAQQIPFLEAELRRELAGMGYTLGEIGVVEPANSTAVVVEPEAAVETPQDMSDWRNWREGDFLTVIQKRYGHKFSIGQIVQIKTISEGSICCADRSDEWYLEDDEARWHSRPAKGEK
jgi:hypothetical protein